MIQWDTKPKFCILSTWYKLKKTCHQNKWSSTHLRQSYLFLRRDVRLSEFNWCIKASLSVGSIDSTVIKRKKTKQQNLLTSTTTKTNHYKPILSSHSTAAIGCTSHCSTGKAGRTSKIRSPRSTQKGNNLCASQELGHNAALMWPCGFTGSATDVYPHPAYTCTQLPRRKYGKNLHCCISPSEKRKIWGLFFLARELEKGMLWMRES